MRSVVSLADDIAETAERLIKKNGILEPVIMLFTESDNILIFNIDAENYKTKKKSVQLAKLAAVIYRAKYSVVVMEAWYKMVKASEYNSNILPSQCSDREEGLIICVEDNRGNKEYQQYNLIRNIDGSLANIKKIDMDSFNLNVEGLFAGILDGEIDIKPLQVKKIRKMIRQLQNKFKQERETFKNIFH